MESPLLRVQEICCWVQRLHTHPMVRSTYILDLCPAPGSCWGVEYRKRCGENIVYWLFSKHRLGGSMCNDERRPKNAVIDQNVTAFWFDDRPWNDKWFQMRFINQIKARTDTSPAIEYCMSLEGQCQQNSIKCSRWYVFFFLVKDWNKKIVKKA